MKPQSVVVLSAKATHHVRTVLRMKPGSKLRIFDGEGAEFNAAIARDSDPMPYDVRMSQKHQIPVVVKDQLPDGKTESRLSVVLAQAVLKGRAMERVIQNSVQLGVTEIVPVYTDRCMARESSPARQRKKHEHWYSIAVSACEQTGRAVVPLVHRPQPLDNFLQLCNSVPPLRVDNTATEEDGAEDGESPFLPASTRPSVLQHIEHRVILSPTSAYSLRKRFFVPPSGSEAGAPTGFVLFVGPESGLSDEEIHTATKHGFKDVRLGPRIHRAENAGPVCLAALQGMFGDL